MIIGVGLLDWKKGISVAGGLNGARGWVVLAVVSKASLCASTTTRICDSRACFLRLQSIAMCEGSRERFVSEWIGSPVRF